MSSGERSMFPEHEGQLSGEPVRSLAIKCSACAGLYVAGRGLRMTPPKNCKHDPLTRRPVLKTNRLGAHLQVVPGEAITSIDSFSVASCVERSPGSQRATRGSGAAL
jgi:hypothetical protein